MTKDQLEDALRHWGRVFGEQVTREPGENEKVPASHPIARAMEYGHRSVDRRQSVAYQRTIRAGEKSWSRDPILCAETRSSHFAAPIAPPRTSMAEQVQSAWLSLVRYDPALANVLRVEYHVRGETQRGRADQAGLSMGKYREMLAEAKGWMMGRMILAIAA